jgi:hypothetical protein
MLKHPSKCKNHELIYSSVSLVISFENLENLIVIARSRLGNEKEQKNSGWGMNSLLTADGRDKGGSAAPPLEFVCYPLCTKGFPTRRLTLDPFRWCFSNLEKCAANILFGELMRS